MHEVIETVRTSLKYAKFDDKELKTKAQTLLEELGKDLEVLDYQSNDAIDEAQKELVDRMNELDAAAEELDEKVAEASSEVVPNEEA